MYQLTLYTRSADELSTKRKMSPGEARRWKEKRKQREDKKQGKVSQSPEPGPNPGKNETINGQSVEVPSDKRKSAPKQASAPTAAPTTPFATSLQPGRAKRSRKIDLARVWNAAMGERDPKQVIRINEDTLE